MGLPEEAQERLHIPVSGKNEHAVFSGRKPPLKLNRN